MPTPERESKAERPPGDPSAQSEEPADGQSTSQPTVPARRRRRVSVETAAEEAIREAMERGDFDALPGRGQPLRWDTERDDEWWLANHMLQNAGYRPAWIERDKAIREEREALRRMLDDHVAWHRDHTPEEPPAALRQAADLVAQRYRDRAAKLNRDIDSHNLTVPVEGLQRLRLPVAAQLTDFYARLGLSPEG